VFQAAGKGLARSFPKLVSPVSDLIAADSALVVVLILLIGSCVDVHRELAWQTVWNVDGTERAHPLRINPAF
jgi:hypothetical protein